MIKLEFYNSEGSLIMIRLVSPKQTMQKVREIVAKYRPEGGYAIIERI